MQNSKLVIDPRTHAKLNVASALILFKKLDVYCSRPLWRKQQKTAWISTGLADFHCKAIQLLDSTIAAALVRQIYRSVLSCFPVTTPCLPHFVIWPIPAPLSQPSPPAHALVCAPQLLFAPEAFVTIAPVTTIIVAAGEAHCAKMTPYDSCLELEVFAIGANSCVICANDVMSDVHNCTELNTTKYRG